MRQPLVALLVMAIALAACGKKSSAPPPGPDSAPQKVSIDSAPAEPPPPPPVAAAAPDAAPAPDPNEGNWWSKKAVGEKREIMEGWLHQYQTANAASKTEIIKQIKTARLSAADWTVLEELRAGFKYPPLPVK